MADAIPASLKYSAQSAQARVIKQTVQPQGNSNGTSASQSIFRFRLPEKSLVDLRSIAIYYDYAFTGTVDAAANWSTAAIPASYKHFSQVKWYVSGAPASNHMCNHYDMVYDALRKASTNAEWCNSRLGNGYASCWAQRMMTLSPCSMHGQVFNVVVPECVLMTFSALQIQKTMFWTLLCSACVNWSWLCRQVHLSVPLLLVMTVPTLPVLLVQSPTSNCVLIPL